LLIDFHSVGKTSKYFVLLFLPDGAFFQVCGLKQILALFLFSASAYYRANYIVCVCGCACVCVVVRVCVCGCVCVCVCVGMDLRVCAWLCMRLCVWLCGCACVRACGCVCVCVL